MWSCVNFAVDRVNAAPKTVDMNIFMQIERGLLLGVP